MLLDHDAAIEYWSRGRLHVVTDATAPSADAVLARVLREHRRRFRYLPQAATPVDAGGDDLTGAMAADSGGTAGIGNTVALLTSGASDPAGLRAWLARAGRFMNASATNSLGVVNDAQALAVFLRDRAHRSPHTLRAYRTELRRLIGWCHATRRGPLSDLTRDDLLAFRQWLDQSRSNDALAIAHTSACGAIPGRRERSNAGGRRALAVVSSLFRYWQKTGYLVINPAAELSGGAAARTTWTPVRSLPARVLTLCDAVTAGDRPSDVSPVVWARRCAIWSLYRFAGVRLAELEWSTEHGLPRVSLDVVVCTGDYADECAADAWTLHVLGKGRKVRAIPLPSRCEPVLRAYRLTRGLPAEPAPVESVPLIHSEKRDALGHSGLYDEVKAVLQAAEAHVPPGDVATRTLLRAASTHWLRHGYARALVVDHAVPLPVAQTLLGHASVQTTAAYARTDLTQLRDFVEGSFSKS
jgi:site-specific recombinase XerD